MNEDRAPAFVDGGDPRMRGFKTRTSVLDLTAWIIERVNAVASEEIALVMRGDASSRARSRPASRLPRSIGPRWMATPFVVKRASGPRPTHPPCSAVWGGLDRASAVR